MNFFWFWSPKISRSVEFNKSSNEIQTKAADKMIWNTAESIWNLCAEEILLFEFFFIEIRFLSNFGELINKKSCKASDKQPDKL